MHAETARRRSEGLEAEDGVRKARCTISRYPCWAVHRRRGCQGLIHGKVAFEQVSERIAFVFISEEEEKLVFLDGPACRGPKLFKLDGTFVTQTKRRRAENGAASVYGGGVEIVAGIQRIAAPEGVRSPMQTVGPGLQSNVNDRARFPSVLGRRIFNDVELLNRVDRQNGCGISLHTSAVNHGERRQWVVVREAVNDVTVILRMAAVR